MDLFGLSFDARPLIGLIAALVVITCVSVWVRNTRTSYAGLVAGRKEDGGSEEIIEDDDIDQMHAWSITARLAHLPDEQLGGLPEGIASLIREAKDLHPKVAEGARNVGD